MPPDEVPATGVPVFTPSDLGHAIRFARQDKSMTQAAFAAGMGVSRKWLSEAERGKSSIEVGLALAALPRGRIYARHGQTARARVRYRGAPAVLDGVLAVELAVLIGGEAAGSLDLSGSQPSFEYAPPYAQRGGPPLSIRFPLSGMRAAGEELRWWLEGLLPDDTDTIRSLRREHGLRGGDYLRLLGTPMGADCAGAVQFCPPEGVDHLLSETGSEEPITEGEIAEWLRRIRINPGNRAFRVGRADSGFSLAGAQPKVAVRRSPDGGWVVPDGPIPTTHIIKLARQDSFANEAVTEHLVMEAVRRIGVAAARTKPAHFNGVEVLVVERFDRSDDGSARIHQEDFCQALGYRPDRKYEHEGGPAPDEIARGLRRADPAAADANVGRFRDALLCQWLVASIDGHAKNHSVMLLGQGTARLAPVYDLNSWLPYRQTTPTPMLRMAMRVGSDFALGSADAPEAMRLTAERLGLSHAETAERAAELAAKFPWALDDAIGSLPPAMADLPVVGVLHGDLSARASQCRDIAESAVQQARPRAGGGRGGPLPSTGSLDLDLSEELVLPGCGHIGVRSKKRCLRRQHPNGNHRY